MAQNSERGCVCLKCIRGNVISKVRDVQIKTKCSMCGGFDGCHMNNQAESKAPMNRVSREKFFIYRGASSSFVPFRNVKFYVASYVSHGAHWYSLSNRAALFSKGNSNPRESSFGTLGLKWALYTLKSIPE